MKRLYSEKNAPLCTACRGPMAPHLGENTHPACDYTMPELRSRLFFTLARREAALR